MKQLITSLRGSLRLEILALYMILACTGVVFFSAVILENQSDLLVELFRYQSRETARELGAALRATERTDPAQIAPVLARHSVTDFALLDREGRCIYPAGCTPSREVTEIIRTLAAETALFRTESHIRLDVDSARAFFVVPADDRQQQFVRGVIPLVSMQMRMSHVSRQLWLAGGWMLLLNLLFAAYLYRRIFRRVGKLKTASEQMSRGDLSARAQWKFRSDELDHLGMSFNAMAGTIEQQVKQISDMNHTMHEELLVGKDVQEVMLTRREELKSRGIHLYFRPLREVSGDIYVFETLERAGKRWEVLFLADATGHGVPAALITTILMLSFREALTATLHPARILAKLNELMHQRLRSQYFATACLFLKDPAGRVHFAGAAQPPPLWFRPSTGALLEISEAGPMLGLLPGAEFTAVTVPAKKGDLIFVYSDGLSEGARGSEFFGMDRIKTAVARAPSPEALVSSLAEELDAFVEGHRDDVTFFAFEVK